MFGNDELWNRVERLELERRCAHREHEEALRDLHAACLEQGNERRRCSWQRYCDAIEALEHTTQEVQQLTFAAEPARGRAVPSVWPSYVPRHSKR